MKLKYVTSSKHFAVVCNETGEEQTFETEQECVDWAKRVVHTFQESLTFKLTKVQEQDVEIWVDKNQEAGAVR